MKISLIHPSRQRPEKSFETINKWLNRADSKIEKIEIIISLDQDDPTIQRYRELYPLNQYRRIIIGDNTSAIRAINMGAFFAKGDILVVVSDDTDCPQGWDTILMDIAKKHNDWICKFQDGIQDWVITMPVMDRAYYQRFNYIYHPSYEHCFCDTELTCVAELTGRLITSKVNFPHKHYSVTGEGKDEVSEKADATFMSGRANFIARGVKDFDLKPEQIVGKFTPTIYAVMIGEAKLRERGITPRYE